MQLFAKSGIDEDVLNQKEVINLLNVAVNATVTGYGSKTVGEGEGAKTVIDTDTVNNVYEISLNTDIDPFELLQLLKLENIDFKTAETQAALVNIIKNLGTIKFTVDETTAGAEHNVLTIIADLNGKDAKLIFAIAPYSPIPSLIKASYIPLAFEVSVDEIAEALGIGGATTAAGEDIIATIIEVIGRITTIDVSGITDISDILGALGGAVENGLYFDVNGILGYLYELLNIKADTALTLGDLVGGSTIGSLVDILVFGDTKTLGDMFDNLFNTDESPYLGIEVTGVSYGNADTAYDMSAIEAFISNNFSLDGSIAIAGAENNIVKEYDIAIDGDINIAALLGLTKGTDTANIIEVVKNLGNLSIIVTNGDEHVFELIADLNGADAQVGISVSLTGQDIQIGRAFTVDELVKLFSGSSAAAHSEALVAADGGTDIMSILLTVIQVFAYTNIEEEIGGILNDIGGTIVSIMDVLAAEGFIIDDLAGLADFAAAQLATLLADMGIEDESVTALIGDVLNGILNTEEYKTVTIRLDNAVFGAGDPVGIDALTPSDNLNFSLDAAVQGYNATGAESTTFDIKVDADINIAKLFDLMNGTDKETVMGILNELGYLRLTIDETTEGYAGNVLTLFFDTSAEKAIYLNVNLNDLNVSMANIASKAQLGGRYSLEYLYDMIAGLLGGATASAEEEGGIDIAGILGSLFAAIALEDSALNIDLEAVVEVVTGILTPILEGINLGDIESLLSLVGGKEGLARGLVGALLNVNSGVKVAGGNERPNTMLNTDIKISVTGSGACDKDFTAADVADSHIVINEGDNTGYVKELTDGGVLVDGSFKVVKGFENNLSAIMPNGGVVILTGTDISGATEQQFSGYVIGVDGVDGSIVGTAQDVTYNVIVGGNDLIALLSGFGMSPASLPLFGEPVKVEGKITLIDSTCEDISKPEAKGLASEAKPMVNTCIYDYMFAEGASSVTITVEGMTYTLDVTKPASVTKEGSDEDIKDTLKGGIINETGSYVVTYDFAGWKYAVNVTVVEKPDLALVNDTYTVNTNWGTMKSGKFSFEYTLNGAPKTHTVSSAEVKGLIVQVVDIEGLYGDAGSIVDTNEIFGSGTGSLMYKINRNAKPGKYEVYINTPDGILVDEITIVGA